MVGFRLLFLTKIAEATKVSFLFCSLAGLNSFDACVKCRNDAGKSSMLTQNRGSETVICTFDASILFGYDSTRIKEAWQWLLCRGNGSETFGWLSTEGFQRRESLSPLSLVIEQDIARKLKIYGSAWCEVIDS